MSRSHTAAQARQPPGELHAAPSKPAAPRSPTHFLPLLDNSTRPRPPPSTMVAAAAVAAAPAAAARAAKPVAGAKPVLHYFTAFRGEWCGWGAGGPLEAGRAASAARRSVRARIDPRSRARCPRCPRRAWRDCQARPGCRWRGVRAGGCGLEDDEGGSRGLPLCLLPPVSGAPAAASRSRGAVAAARATCRPPDCSPPTHHTRTQLPGR